jgi:hypothetical protein
LKIIIFDSGSLISYKSSDFETKIITDFEILDDNIGLGETISGFEKLLYISPFFNEEVEFDNKKYTRQVVNLIDTCLFISIPLIIVCPFTPYYSNTNSKKVNEKSINETNDLDSFSLFLHSIAEEVERGRHEGLDITFLRSGFTQPSLSLYHLLLKHQWHFIPKTSYDTLQKIVNIQIAMTKDSSNYIIVDEIVPLEESETFLKLKNSFRNKLFSIFKKEIYDSTLLIQLDNIFSRSIQ